MSITQLLLTQQIKLTCQQLFFFSGAAGGGAFGGPAGTLYICVERSCQAFSYCLSPSGAGLGAGLGATATGGGIAESVGAAVGGGLGTAAAGIGGGTISA